MRGVLCRQCAQGATAVRLARCRLPSINLRRLRWERAAHRRCCEQWELGWLRARAAAAGCRSISRMEATVTGACNAWREARRWRRRYAGAVHSGRRGRGGRGGDDPVGHTGGQQSWALTCGRDRKERGSRQRGRGGDGDRASPPRHRWCTRVKGARPAPFAGSTTRSATSSSAGATARAAAAAAASTAAAAATTTAATTAAATAATRRECDTSTSSATYRRRRHRAEAEPSQGDRCVRKRRSLCRVATLAGRRSAACSRARGRRLSDSHRRGDGRGRGRG